MSVFERRVMGIYGYDHLLHSAKHKSLDAAVEGMKQRIAQAQNATRHK